MSVTVYVPRRKCVAWASSGPSLPNCAMAPHHHGMTTSDILRSDRRREALQAVLEYWDGTLSTCPKYGDLLKPVLATDKRVLVSPVGMTPGVLLTALETCRRDERMGEPTLCIIICSDQSQATINEALRDHGGYRGEIRTLIFQDPQAGISELDQITGPAAQLLRDAQEVVINITGGTTIMGVAVEKIASDAQKMARNANTSRTTVRRVGLIDRRPTRSAEGGSFRGGRCDLDQWPGWMKMAVEINARYLVTTPLFGRGADDDRPELRLPSFKGVLRFWWRALAWSRLQGDPGERRSGRRTCCSAAQGARTEPVWPCA